MAPAVGVEPELELAFASLHELCAPVLDRLDRLTDLQHAALVSVFGSVRIRSPEERSLDVGVASSPST